MVQNNKKILKWYTNNRYLFTLFKKYIYLFLNKNKINNINNNEKNNQIWISPFYSSWGTWTHSGGHGQ